MHCSYRNITLLSLIWRNFIVSLIAHNITLSTIYYPFAITFISVETNSYISTATKQSLALQNTQPPNYKRNENKIPWSIWVISASQNWCNLPLVSCTDTWLCRGDAFRSGMSRWAVILHPAFGSLTHMCANRWQACRNHYFLRKMSSKWHAIYIVQTCLHTSKPAAVGDMAGVKLLTLNYDNKPATS